MSLDIVSLQDWVGRTTEAEDILTPRLAASFRATFAPHLAIVEDGEASLGSHWCLAPEIVEASRLNVDGHPLRGDFLPPVALPRRMWASGELELLSPLRVGDHVRRRSTVESVTEKNGKSGPLCFVTVLHVLGTERGAAVKERHVIVYRAPSQARAESEPGGKEAAFPVTEHTQEVAVDPVLLFRYSALTFNGHRIHYDAPYTIQTEGYRGLVVHGPLQATLLLNFAASVGGGTPRGFSFRAVRPATVGQVFRLRAAPAKDGTMELGVEADGSVSMMATARW